MAETRPINPETIRALPKQAIYVLPINFKMLSRAVRVAAELQRGDITFVTPLFLDPEALNMLPGRRPVVVDPLAYLEPEQQKTLDWYRGN